MQFQQGMNFVEQVWNPLHLIQNEAANPKPILLQRIQAVLPRLLGVAGKLLGMQQVDRPGRCAEAIQNQRTLAGLTWAKQKKGTGFWEIERSFNHHDARM
jgi:hypothetical protein